MITIKVNDTPKTLSESITIEQLIEELEIQTNGIAVAVNNTVVEKSDWEFQEVFDTDNVLIIKSTQGG